MNWPISFSSTTADWVISTTVAGLQHLVFGAGLQAHVLLAEQAGGQDGRGGVGRKRVAPVDLELDHGR
jgi:hypothetical protein